MYQMLETIACGNVASSLNASYDYTM